MHQASFNLTLNKTKSEVHSKGVGRCFMRDLAWIQPRASGVSRQKTWNFPFSQNLLNMYSHLAYSISRSLRHDSGIPYLEGG